MVRSNVIRLVAWCITFLLLLARAHTFAQTHKKSQPSKEPGGAPLYALVETSMGSFEIELLEDAAPRAVENFASLAEKKFFDGTRVHRISRTQGFIQMGDDKSKDTTKVKEWGTGGRSIWGKEFQDEIDSKAALYRDGYKKGIVAMATRGPNMNTSQFFIMVKDAPFMPRNYTIFGRVVAGQEVVDRIGSVEIIPQMSLQDGRPHIDVIIKRITISKTPTLRPEAHEGK